MPAIVSRLDPGSAAFAANAARMGERLAEVRRLERLVVDESAARRDKFEQRGQLLPRERVVQLLDRGSGFLELSPLAGLGMHDDDGKKSVQGGGAIVGIGLVAGKRVVVSASDSALSRAPARCPSGILMTSTPLIFSARARSTTCSA